MSIEEWLAVNAERAGRALANPAVRDELHRLMSDDGEEARQRRRRAELEHELSVMEWRWRYSGSEAADN